MCLVKSNIYWASEPNGNSILLNGFTFDKVRIPRQKLKCVFTPRVTVILLYFTDQCMIDQQCFSACDALLNFFVFFCFRSAAFYTPCMNYMQYGNLSSESLGCKNNSIICDGLHMLLLLLESFNLGLPLAAIFGVNEAIKYKFRANMWVSGCSYQYPVYQAKMLRTLPQRHVSK